MIVIPPIVITEAMLTSSTLAEPGPGETEWSAITNYQIGDRVIRLTTHKIYECVQAGVNSTLPENYATKWLEVGPTNKWAMFDLSRDTTSDATTDITIVIATGMRFDTIGIINTSAARVQITVTSGAITTFSSDDIMSTRYTDRWYKYFFGKFSYKSGLIKSGIPPTLDSIVTITFTIPSSGSVGNVILGTKQQLGNIQVKPTVEAINFSKIDRDIYGNASLVPRRSVPRTTQKTFTTKANVNKLISVRETLNAAPALWAGLEDDTDGYFEALLIFGIYKEFSISMDYPDYAIVDLQLEEI